MGSFLFFLNDQYVLEESGYNLVPSLSFFFGHFCNYQLLHSTEQDTKQEKNCILITSLKIDFSTKWLIIRFTWNGKEGKIIFLKKKRIFRLYFWYEVYIFKKNPILSHQRFQILFWLQTLLVVGLYFYCIHFSQGENCKEKGPDEMYPRNKS